MDMKLTTLTRFLNKKICLAREKDSSRNGLQVKGKKDVYKVGLAVDACMDVFKKAKKLKCDAVIVHHGLLWKNKKRLNGARGFCRE